MGSFTPKPKIKQMNMKLTSNSEKYKLLTLKNVELPDIKNRYIKAMIRNKAPNCVQKNIKYAASTALLVFANL